MVLSLACALCVDAVGDDAPAASSYVGSCLLLDVTLGWCCVLCDLLNATNATAEGGVNHGRVDSDSRRAPPATGGAVLAPRVTYRRRVNVEPLELEVHAWTGRVASAAVDFAARQVTLIFEDAAAASGGPTASALRVERARASAARGFALLDPLDGTTFEHGA